MQRSMGSLNEWHDTSLFSLYWADAVDPYAGTVPPWFVRMVRLLWPGFSATSRLADIISIRPTGEYTELRTEMWAVLLFLSLIAIQVLFFLWRVMNPHLAMLLVIAYSLIGLGLSNSVVLNLGIYTSPPPK